MPCDERHAKAQDLCHFFLRLEALFRLRGKRSDSAAHFQDEGALFHFLETLDFPFQLIRPAGCLETEGDRDGMDDVRPSCFRRIPVLLHERKDRGKTGLRIAQDDGARFPLHEDEARVIDILARRAPVDVLASIARKALLERIEKRHDRDRASEALRQSIHVDFLSACVADDYIRRFPGNHAQLSLRPCQRRFRVEPLLHPVLLTPHRSHFIRSEKKSQHPAVFHHASHHSLLLRGTPAPLFPISYPHFARP